MHILAALGDKKNNVVLSVFGVDFIIPCFKNCSPICGQNITQFGEDQYLY